jgi:outer membrane lipoprotein-sorting protein
MNYPTVRAAAVIAVLFMPVISGASSQQTADDIVLHVLSILAPGEFKARYLFTNFRTDGTKNTYTIDVLAKNRSLLHLTFVAPAREAGRQVLNKNGEIWSFLPDSRKVIRLADRESLANGDFNNADVMKLNWHDDYAAEIAKETAQQLVIDLTAKPDKNPAYFHMRLWVLKDNLQPVQQYFYDQAGHHLKILKYRKVRSFGDLTRPSELTMENVVTGQKTLLQIMEFQRVDNLPVDRFSPENLGK